jgi:L-iditol 2-dehydrogenase
MKSLVLAGKRKLKLIDAPVPGIRAKNDVLLKIEAIGICGSDIHYYTRGRIGTQIVTYPFRIGHECSAIVVDAGRSVKRVRPGDLVAVDPAVWCGKCDQCRKGRFHTCRSLRFLGAPGQGEGCLCEYIVMPEASCYPVRRRTSSEVAALIEPLSIGYYAVSLSSGIKGKNVAILGSGPIGLSVLLVARIGGARRVYVTDKIDGRLQIAGTHGATWTGNPDKQNVLEDILSREPLQLDLVFECCGQQEAIDQALEMLAPGGELILVGVPDGNRIGLEIDTARRREIAIRNVRRQNECVGPALKLVESGKIDPRFMITHRYTFETAVKGFDLAAKYGDGVIKAMILPGM